MKSTNQEQILKYLLYSGALYFFSVAVVHSLGIKIPGLFVYFNVPSYAYQDRIISFLSFGWSAFFFLAGKKKDSDQIRLILVIGLVAILALLINSLVTDFSRLDVNIEPVYFLIITFGLFLYWLFLLIFSWKLLTGKKE